MMRTFYFYILTNEMVKLNLHHMNKDDSLSMATTLQPSNTGLSSSLILSEPNIPEISDNEIY